MSENSIDVDVNFHLNDINKIFEKIMEGTDTDIFKGLSDISDLDDEMKASLLESITSVDDKTKLLEALTNLNVTAPIAEDMYKMIEEMSGDQGDQTTIIERTQKSMITLLTISKTMMKLFEEKFPISDEMQKELDIMNRTLNDQSLILDDKMDILLRSMNNMFAPIKEEIPRAFRTIRPTDAPRVMDFLDKDRTRAGIDEMIDFVDQVTNKYEDLFRAMDEGQERFRHTEERPELEDIRDIGNNLRGTLIELRDLVTEERDPGGTIADTSDIVVAISDEAKLAFDKIQQVMDEIEVIFKETAQINAIQITESVAASQDLRDKTTEMKNEVGVAVEMLNVAVGEISGMKDAVKNQIGTGILAIKNMLNSDYFQGTIEDVLNQLIREELVQPIHTTRTAQDLEYILRIAEASLNTFNRDLERLMVGKSEEELREMGLSDVAQVKGVIERSRERQRRILRDEETIFSSPISRDIDMEGLSSLDRMEGLLETIATRTREQDNMTVRIDDNLRELLIQSQMTNILAESSFEKVAQFDDQIKMTIRATEKAADWLHKMNQTTEVNTHKIREIAERWNDEFPGRDVDTSNNHNRL